MYTSLSQQGDVPCGNLRLLFSSWQRAGRFIACILTGSAIYIYLAIFVVFTPEIGRALALPQELTSGQAMLYGGASGALGNFVCGSASQWFGTRKKILFLGVLGFCFVGLAMLSGAVTTASMYYIAFSVFCFFVGIWSVLISFVAEQFGTNLRATATTSVPNFVRGFGIIHTSSFIALKGMVGIVPAIQIIFGFFYRRCVDRVMLFARDVRHSFEFSGNRCQTASRPFNAVLMSPLDQLMKHLSRLPGLGPRFGAAYGFAFAETARGLDAALDRGDDRSRASGTGLQSAAIWAELTRARFVATAEWIAARSAWSKTSPISGRSNAAVLFVGCIMCWAQTCRRWKASAPPICALTLCLNG